MQTKELDRDCLSDYKTQSIVSVKNNWLNK